MAYKWKPSASQRRAFAEKMQDPIEAQVYEDRKKQRAEKRRAESKYNYSNAGGQYIPTQYQYDVCWKIIGDTTATEEQKDAANIVMSAWTCQDKVHHDYIHVVNEWDRSKMR